MRRLFSLLLIAGALSCVEAVAQEPAWQPPPGTTTINVWPGRAPGVPDNTNSEVDTTTAKDNLIAGKPLIRLGNVSQPTLTVYQPERQEHRRRDRRFPRRRLPHSCHRFGRH